jgi:hypothetical protein
VSLRRSRLFADPRDHCCKRCTPRIKPSISADIIAKHAIAPPIIQSSFVMRSIVQKSATGGTD